MGASRCSAGSLSAVPVCLCARLKPANRHAGKSFQIEVSDKFYMFSRGAGSPCKYQPNEEACMWHWYQWRHAVMYLLRMCFELRTVEHVSISGCCRYRYIILRQPASSGWLPRNPEGDVNLIPLKFQFGGIRSAVCVCACFLHSGLLLGAVLSDSVLRGDIHNKWSKVNRKVCSKCFSRKCYTGWWLPPPQSTVWVSRHGHAKK